MSSGVAMISRSQFVEVIREWREEWDTSPNQFLVSEQFRQSDPAVYAEEVANHLWGKLMNRHGKGGQRS